MNSEHGAMYNQLSRIHGTVKTVKSPDDEESSQEIITTGRIEIKTPAGVVITEEDQRELIQTHKQVQKAMLWEKRASMCASIGMAVLASVTALGSAIALYRGITGNSK